MPSATGVVQEAGVPAGVALTPYTGPSRITQPGTVIDSKIITTPLVITAGANDVTIKNSIVRANGFWLVLNDEGATNLQIIDTELDGQGNTNNDAAVAGRNYTLTRVNIHGTIDGLKLGDDLAGPETGCVHVGDRVFGDGLLLIARVEDRGAVAGADVVALPVLRRRIVDLEEEFEDFAEADLLRVEDDLDRLGVRAVIAIGGVRDVAAGVADAGRDHARIAAQQVLHAPEATPGQNRAFGGPCHDRLLFGCAAANS